MPQPRRDYVSVHACIVRLPVVTPCLGYGRLERLDFGTRSHSRTSVLHSPSPRVNTRIILVVVCAGILVNARIDMIDAVRQ